MTPAESCTPQELVKDLQKNWQNVPLPANRPPKWISQLAEDLEDLAIDEDAESVDEKEWLRRRESLIKETFGQHSTRPATAVVYLSCLKVLLINNGALVNPHYMDLLEQACVQKQCPREIVDLMEALPNNFNRWKLHQRIYKPLRLTFRYLRPMNLNGELLATGTCLEVKRKQMKALLARSPITVSRPQALLEWMDAGLKLKSKKKNEKNEHRFASILLACGRRPLTLYVPANAKGEPTFALIPGDNSRIVVREWVKKRGKTFTSTIPLLCSAKTFMDAVEKFHEIISPPHAPKCAPDQIQTMYGAWMRKACEKVPYVRGPAGAARPCDMRAIYAAYICHDQRDVKTSVAAVKEALLHERAETTLNYLRVNLEWDREAEELGKKTRRRKRKTENGPTRRCKKNH